MEKNRRAGMGGHLGRGIVGDEQFQRMSRVILLHLLLIFPGAGRYVVEQQVPVIVWRRWILDPQIALADLMIGPLRMLGNARGITPHIANPKHSGGCPPITLALGGGSSSQRVHSKPPYQAVATETGGPGVPDASPDGTAFLIKTQRGMRAVPAVCHPDDALGRFHRKLETTGCTDSQQNDR